MSTSSRGLVRGLLPALLTATVAGFVLASCGGGDLTRSRAAKLIAENGKFEPAKKLKLQREAGRAGYSQGFWDSRGNLTDKGRQHFDLGPSQETMVFDLHWGRSAGVKKPLSVAIEVTGIADIPLPSALGSFKEAQFSWRYANLDPPLGRFAVRGGTGTAVFRRFDDGWRIEEIETKEADEPYPIDDEERARIAAELDSESDRRAAEADRLEEAKNRKREADVRQAEMLRRARTPAQEPRKFTVYRESVVGGRPQRETVALTDVFLQKGFNTFYFDGWEGAESLPCPETAKPCVRIRGFINGGRTSPHQIYLQFGSQEDRDTFWGELIAARAAWMDRYPELVATE